MPLTRRSLLITAGALSLIGPVPSAFAANFAAKRLRFEEMYAGNSVLGLTFSDKLKALSGSEVRIQGFMAPPLKADADFLVLTKEPVSLCPFCDSDQDWPDSIIVVKLSRRQDFVQANRLIEVTGLLETGSQTDEATGFVSLVRLVNARYKVV